MKFFDTDWDAIYQWLPVWKMISPAARRHFLLENATHSQPIDESGYGEDLAILMDSGMAVPASAGRCKPAAASVPFRALFRQLGRFPLFDKPPTREFLTDYTRKHYLRDESDYIQNAWKQPAWDSLAWHQAFVASDDVPAWEKGYLTPSETRAPEHYPWNFWRKPEGPLRITRFSNPETIEAAKCLVSAALESPGPLALDSLPTLLPDLLRPFFAAALKACLRYQLLYPALRADTLDPVIGLCPTVMFARMRPPAVTPPALPCGAPVATAFLLEDLTRVLAEAATDGCRLIRGGYGVGFFKIIEEQFVRDFVELPGWIAGPTELRQRISNATRCLLGLKFAEDKTLAGKRYLRATAKGRRWLTGPPDERLRELLCELKGRHSSPYSDYGDRLQLLSNSIRFGNQSGPNFDHLTWLESIWRQAPTEHFVAVNAFLDYHARISNPLVNPGVLNGSPPTVVSHATHGRRVLREQDVEQITRELMEKFFWGRLVPLGCVETGLGDGDHEVCFRLASAGCYLFGLSAELSYGAAETAASVVVQPNFEIVFLHPNLTAELDFAPFAERCGKQVGVLFRLNRRRAIRAAALGVDVTDVLAALARHSSKPVPTNVAEELRAWFGSCRTLTQRKVVIIEAPDPETAVRVQRLLGEQATWRGDSRVEWQGDSIPADLRRKLSENGLFF